MITTKDTVDASLRMVNHFREQEAAITAGAPAPINALRRQALQDFVAQGLPTRKTENYKYTHLQKAFALDYSFSHHRDVEEFHLETAFKCGIPQLNTHFATVRNGWYFAEQRQALPESVVLDSLMNAAAKFPDVFSKYYGQQAETSSDALVALNTMFAQDGYFLYVPRNVKIEQPIQIVNLLQGNQNAYVTQRNLIIVEPGAEVSFIICDHTLNDHHYLSNNVTEMFVGENGVARYYTVQNQHNHAVSVNSVYTYQERDARVHTHTITLHGGLIRNNLKVVLDGENGEANLYGMAFLDRKQHVDNFTQIVHAKPHCQSNQLYKNVLDDEATGAFSGRINVRRDAQKTNAFQRNNNLLLTDKAQMQTKPQLIIEADDVKCSHGATIGQINEEALFYLRSRGIAEKQARLMMMNAFSYEVVQNIAVEPLRDRINELVEKRLTGDLGRCHDCAYQCEC